MRVAPGGPRSSRSGPVPPRSSWGCCACCSPELGNTRGLGPVGAIGIAGAVVAALTFLPGGPAAGRPVALLAAGPARGPRARRGRRGQPRVSGGGWPAWSDGTRGGSGWSRCSRSWCSAAFVPTLQADGITQSELFLDQVESVAGQEVLAAPLPGRVRQPGRDRRRPRPGRRRRGHRDAGRRRVGGRRDLRPARRPAAAEGRRRQGAGAGHAAPGRRQPGRRGRRHAGCAATLDPVGTDVLVGGSTAVQPRRQARQRARPAGDHPGDPAGHPARADAAAALGGGPVLLVARQRASRSARRWGVSALVFNHVFDFPGADPSMPLYAFVFLVALGIDYSIFLMTRVREESRHPAPRPGMLRRPGGHRRGDHQRRASCSRRRSRRLAIIPILFLAQIAFLVAFGVLLDTLVVRSLLVPALALRHRPPDLVAQPARGTAGPARTHRPHGLGSRAWSTSVSQVSPPPVRASTPR